MPPIAPEGSNGEGLYVEKIFFQSSFLLPHKAPTLSLQTMSQCWCLSIELKIFHGIAGNTCQGLISLNLGDLPDCLGFQVSPRIKNPVLSVYSCSSLVKEESLGCQTNFLIQQ